MRKVDDEVAIIAEHLLGRLQRFRRWEVASDLQRDQRIEMDAIVGSDGTFRYSYEQISSLSAIANRGRQRIVSEYQALLKRKDHPLPLFRARARKVVPVASLEGTVKRKRKRLFFYNSDKLVGSFDIDKEFYGHFDSSLHKSMRSLQN